MPKHDKHKVRITDAALQAPDGTVFSLPRPARHCEVMFQLAFVKTGSAAGVQGFLDNKGRFVNRKQAALIARQAGQLTKPLISNAAGLTTEDLW